MLRMIARTPHPVLRPHVTGPYWGYSESGPPVRRVEVVQTGIVLHLALGPALEVDGKARASFVAGLYDAPVTLDHDGEQHGVQVNLTPLGARRLLARPLGDLARAAVALDDLLGRAGAELQERIGNGSDWHARFDVLEAWLLRRLRDAPAPRPDVAFAWSRLAATGGRVPVGAICTELGCSRRHLASRFGAELGLGPKTVGRMLRFERADAAIRAGYPLAAVAAACGYADQAHLTREFRALAGRTPSVHRAEVTKRQDHAVV